MVQIGQINLSTEDFNNIVNAVETAGWCGGSQGVGSTDNGGGGGGSVGALVNVGFAAPVAPAPAGDGNIFFDFLDGTITTRVKLQIIGGSSTLQQSTV